MIPGHWLHQKSIPLGLCGKGGCFLQGSIIANTDKIFLKIKYYKYKYSGPDKGAQWWWGWWAR